MDSEEIKKEEIKIDNFENTYTALKSDLITRLKWYKNQDDDFCIIDRINTAFFFHAFRDSLFKYDSNVLLCERLFFKEKCNSFPLVVPELSEDHNSLIDEFNEFSENLPVAENLTDEEQKEVSDKLDAYQKSLRGIISDNKERILFNYEDNATSISYLLTPLNDINDEALDCISTIISNFILSYFQTMSYNSKTDKLEVMGIQHDDYIDIVIVMN